MTTFGALSTGMEDPAYNVLVNSTGTRKTKTALISDLGTAEVNNPVYRVPDNYRLFERGDLPGDAGNPVNYRQVLVPGALVTSAQIDAMYPAPTVSTVTPATGTTAGGTAVTIVGTNFKHTGTTVTFGGTAATSVVIVSDTELTCVTPAKSAAAYTVAVLTDSGTGSKATAFTYS